MGVERDGGASSRTTLQQPSGLAGACLRQALHDLRGPLNTLAILHEILRASEDCSSEASREALDSADRNLRVLSTMLDRLREVADSTPTQLERVDLRDALRRAIEQRGDRPELAMRLENDEAAVEHVWSCPERLSALFETLLACAASAMQGAGTLRLRTARNETMLHLELDLEGPTVALPAAAGRSRLDATAPGAADWFRLDCQARGLSAELDIERTSAPPRIRIRFPEAC